MVHIICTKRGVEGVNHRALPMGGGSCPYWSRLEVELIVNHAGIGREGMFEGLVQSVGMAVWR